MPASTVRIPATIMRPDEKGQVWGFVPHCTNNHESSIVERSDSASKCRAKIRERVLSILSAAADAERHSRRALIVCNDGTLIVVEYRHGWQHTITGPDRAHAHGNIANWTEFDDAMTAAIDRANGSYGGVSARCPL